MNKVPTRSGARGSEAGSALAETEVRLSPNLMHRVPLEPVPVVDFPHVGLLASKLGGKASTKSRKYWANLTSPPMDDKSSHLV